MMKSKSRILNVYKKKFQANVYGLRSWDKSVFRKARVRNSYFFYTSLDECRNDIDDDEICAGYANTVDNQMIFYKEKLPDFLKLYREKVRKNEAHFFEFIPEDKKVCFYLDCETTCDESTNDLNSILKRFLESVRICWNRVNKRRCNPNIVILDSSKEGKFSKHVRSKDMVFQSTKHLGYFVTLCMYYTLTMGKKRFYKPDEILTKMIDDSVYRDNGTIRMYYSSKYSEKHRKLIHTKNDPYSEDLMKQCSVTKWIDANVVPMAFDVVKNGYKNTPLYTGLQNVLYTNGYKDKPVERTSRTYRVKYNAKNSVKLKKGQNRDVYKILERFVKKNVHHSLSVGNVSVTSENEEIVFIKGRISGQYCPIKKGFHTNRSGRSLFVYVPSKTMTVSCNFNPVCRGKTVKKYPLPLPIFNKLMLAIN